MVKATSKRMMITLSKENQRRSDILMKLYDCTLSQLISDLLVKESVKKGIE